MCEPFIFYFSCKKCNEDSGYWTFEKRVWVRVSWVAQSVLCLATGWTTGRSSFDSRRTQKNFSFNLCVQTGSGVHPASCPMSTGILSQGVKRGRDVNLTIHSHLVPISTVSRSYSSSPPSTVTACSGTALAFFLAVTDWRLTEWLCNL
jgi:hypothetical protein